MNLLTAMSIDEKIPKFLLDAMADPRWPHGRISGSRFQQMAPGLAGIDFELISTPEQLIQNGLADTKTLIRFEESAKTREFLALAAGTKCAHKVELPTLDVEQILVIGGGADWGDDFWMALDFRSGRSNPQVVCNQFANGSCQWLVIARSFSEFCRAIGISIEVDKI